VEHVTSDVVLLDVRRSKIFARREIRVTTFCCSKVSWLVYHHHQDGDAFKLYSVGTRVWVDSLKTLLS
jgi:hypothetical protein